MDFSIVIHRWQKRLTKRNTRECCLKKRTGDNRDFQEPRGQNLKERSLNTHVSSFRSPLYIQRSPGLLGYKQYFNNYCLRLNSAIMNHWLGQLPVSIIRFPLNVILSDTFFLTRFSVIWHQNFESYDFFLSSLTVVYVARWSKLIVSIINKHCSNKLLKFLPNKRCLFYQTCSGYSVCDRESIYA